MVSYEGLRLALTVIDGAQWRSFERLANVFLAEEFPSLRPMATPDGDGATDAVLFVPDGDPSVALQFSLRKDWKRKIAETCDRLRATNPSVSLLVYATNQNIGAHANQLRRQLRGSHRIVLDIRDQEWFLTARNRSAAVEAEAEVFIRPFHEESLVGASLVRKAQALDDLEAKAAFVYLGLQWADDTREKGLTKVCFEAVVRSVLRDTTSDARMSRDEVKTAVAQLLPAQDPVARAQAVDSALHRLEKIFIRHWTKDDQFCLTWDERTRLADRLKSMEILDDALDSELRSLVKRLAEEDGAELTADALRDAVARCRGVLERILLDRGEVFAEAVVHGQGADVKFEDVEAVVYKDMEAVPGVVGVDPRVVAATVVSLMVDPPETVRPYLRSLSDTYTLFAFMRETPDVQSAVVKMFSEGEIWLDASVVLPLFAEELLDEPSRSHGLMLRAATEAGIKLYVTDGVVQELASHVNRSRGYRSALSRGEAYGAEPFLLSAYRLSGRPMLEFEAWADNFCGHSRQEDDVADYLEEEFGIHVAPLIEFVAQLDAQLTVNAKEIWHEARDHKDEKRKKEGLPPMDAGTRALLVEHDVECYIGVIGRRLFRREGSGAFGYKSWWLTLDKTAFRAARELEERTGHRPPSNPAISPDFMLQYLAMGPVRSRLSRRTEEALPLMLNMSILDAVPQDLLDLSDALRKELGDLPPRVVRRKVRDTLDDARLLLGSRARGGERGLNEELKQRLIQRAKER